MHSPYVCRVKARHIFANNLFPTQYMRIQIIFLIFKSDVENIIFIRSIYVQKLNFKINFVVTFKS